MGLQTKVNEQLATGDFNGNGRKDKKKIMPVQLIEIQIRSEGIDQIQADAGRADDTHKPVRVGPSMRDAGEHACALFQQHGFSPLD